MSQFYGTVQGNRGAAHRGGSKDSGIDARIAGWNSGITVKGYFDKETGLDTFVVILNEGNGYNQRRTKVIGRFTQKDLDETAPSPQTQSPVAWVEVDDIAQDIQNLPYQVHKEYNETYLPLEQASELAVKVKDLIRRAAAVGIEQA